MPILNPSSVQDYIDLGLYGYALSRYSGCWVGFPCVTDIVETVASVAVNDDRHRIQVPTTPRWQRDPTAAHGPLIEAERSLYNVRLPAAKEFVRLNRLDRVVLGDEGSNVGIITCGKGYNDVRQALRSLGVDDQRARSLGLSVYKVAMTWPLEPAGVREFCAGKSSLLVIEEKRPLVEDQLKTILFEAGGPHPELLGKADWQGAPLISNYGELSVSDVRDAVARWLEHATGQVLTASPIHVAAQLQVQASPTPARKPAFCAGCPHNTSTTLPDGSIALGGIGCHGMAAMIPERRTFGATPMGCEGANWIGQSSFVDRDHIFQNLGDGTYYHSGILAIRGALSAGVNVTYKILANNAVAMTGGQPVEGDVSAQAIAQQMVAEGVKTIAVVSDEPDKYGRNPGFPSGIPVLDRSKLLEVQEKFRDTPGVSMIIYDQACAAEQRRLRKRHKIVDPPKRLIINELVCEGCGDCNTVSNCIAIEPIDTEFGRKRQINQSACNKDYSCLGGYCPSFVTVHGGELRTATKRAGAVSTGGGSGPAEAAVAALPPDSPRSEAAHCSVLITGVGGAGIVTLGSVLAMAAHLEGKGVSALNVLGMAQKNGPVTSHLRISNDPTDTAASRIGDREADVIIGADPIVTLSAESMRTITKDKTQIVLNQRVQPTSDFARDPDLQFELAPIRRRLAAAAGSDAIHDIDASKWALGVFGDTLMANMMLLGYASQLGLLPVGADALARAIELNGEAVPANSLAFGLGRVAAVNPSEVARLAGESPTILSSVDGSDASPSASTVEEVVAKRAAFLTGYQDAAYAERYRRRVATVQRREQEVLPGASGDLALAVAQNYAKLLAYKDEYEVARLYTDGSFRAQLDREMSGSYRIELNLAPQVFARRDKRTGRAPKRTFGPWVFPVLRVLAQGKKLRGTNLDPLGRTEHRRLERRLIADYEEAIDRLLGGLDVENYETAVAIARYPEGIRGYDTVKEQSLHAVADSLEALWAAFDHRSLEPRAPEPSAAGPGAGS